MSFADDQQLCDLSARFGDLRGVSFTRYGELLTVNIRNRQAVAQILLQGAQVFQFQRHGEQPILWQSIRSDFKAGVPCRGGIPICWPWFGDMARNSIGVQDMVQTSDAEAPLHGLVRQRHWQLANIEGIGESVTRVTLRLDLDLDTEPLWPYACGLTMSIEIGETLKAALTVVNNDQRPLTFSGALHSYLAVSDIAAVSLEGLDGFSYFDATQGRVARTQVGAITVNGEIDRIYQQVPSECQLIDSPWGRSLRLLSEGSESSVIWNPGKGIARRMLDMDDTGYQSMLCIETANVGDDYITLQSGGTHTLSVLIEPASYA